MIDCGLCLCLAKRWQILGTSFQTFPSFTQCARISPPRSRPLSLDRAHWRATLYLALRMDIPTHPRSAFFNHAGQLFHARIPSTTPPNSSTSSSSMSAVEHHTVRWEESLVFVFLRPQRCMCFLDVPPIIGRFWSFGRPED